MTDDPRPWRPPDRRRQVGVKFTTGAALAVVFMVILGISLIELARSGTVKSQLGSSTFLAGRADDYAPLVGTQGPILLPDPQGHDRNVYLQHLGPDPKLGWVTILAVPPGEARTCVIRWEQATHRFEDPCSGNVFPADGAGLTRYPTAVLPSNRIRIDLRVPVAPGYTVTTGTTPTTA